MNNPWWSPWSAATGGTTPRVKIVKVDIFVVVCEGGVWLCAGGEVVVVAGTKRGWDLLQGDTHSQLLALKQGGLPSLCQVGAALTIHAPPARAA